MENRSLSKLKEELGFNLNLSGLVDAMKGIAAAQYHVMERRHSQLEKYQEAVESFFQLYDFRLSRHPFVRIRKKRKIICLLTTDFGFLGGLNLKVITEGANYDQGDADYLVIGERGATYLRETGKPAKTLPDVKPDESRFELVENVLKDLTGAVLSGKAGQAILVYPKSISFTVQRIEAVNLIPCPYFFKNKPEAVPLPEVQKKDLIMESSEDSIVEYMVGLWLRLRLIDAFESAKLSEFGARTMHLEDSYQRLLKFNAALKQEYFKARRSKIDQSLRESYASQLIVGDKEEEDEP